MTLAANKASAAEQLRQIAQAQICTGDAPHIEATEAAGLPTVSRAAVFDIQATRQAIVDKAGKQGRKRVFRSAQAYRGRPPALQGRHQERSKSEE